METQKVKLSQIKNNKDNPRTISKTKFDKLIDSILVFPKMMHIRPIVIDDTYTALGGNMRLKALVAISKMEPTEISQRLSQSAKFNQMTKGERDDIIGLWGSFVGNPDVEVIKASELSEYERREFVVKDNASFGDWDFDKLADEFDMDELDAWGVDIPMGDDGTNDDNGNGGGKDKKDLSGDIKQEFVIEIHCTNEDDQEQLFNEMQERGYECHILTL